MRRPTARHQTTNRIHNMNTAVILMTLFGACLAQQLRQPVTRYSQPVYQVSQPVYHVSQPAVQVVQPASRVADLRKPIAILRQSADQSIDGSFNYEFESENGIQSSAQGSVKSIGTKDQAQVVQGTYSYTAPDGTPISAQYYADETGFHVEGAHLPTPPPVPAEIARSLEILPSLAELERQEQQRVADYNRPQTRTYQ